MAIRRKKISDESKGLDIVAAIGNVTKEKNISMDLVLDSLKDAIASAARRYLDSGVRVEVTVDKDHGRIEACTVKEVVAEVLDPDVEMTLEEAAKVDSELSIGDEVVTELDINIFGRTAIQTAKQIIMQRVREHERQKIFADFSERIGDIVTGTVQQIDKGNILVNLGRTEALLPFKEQIRRERYRQGDNIKGAILEVRDSIKGPQVIMSRNSAAFLERLFEIEVPEIYEGIVKIRKIVRAPGFRAKVAVTTTDPRVDPVGACVGMRGNRVQAIVRELSNERMDIINWTDDISLLVRRVFQPSDIKRVIVVGDTKIVVLVDDDDLAQAIGKEGQNIKLASRFLDREIDIYGEFQFEEFSEAEKDRILASAKDPLFGPLPPVDEDSIEGEFSEDPDMVEVETDTEEVEDADSPIQDIIEEAVDAVAEDELVIDGDEAVKE